MDHPDQVTNELYVLTCGPDRGADQYSGCIVNGITVGLFFWVATGVETSITMG